MCLTQWTWQREGRCEAVTRNRPIGLIGNYAFPHSEIYYSYWRLSCFIQAAATVTLRYRLAGHRHSDVVFQCWLPTTWLWYPWRHNLPHCTPPQHSFCSQYTAVYWVIMFCMRGDLDPLSKVWNAQVSGNQNHKGGGDRFTYRHKNLNP